MNYYNDNDPKAAAWLRELVKQNLIPPGDVDERSIEDVTKSDLQGYAQCHFFAGIGGWLEALRLAGWPADRPVWTGSCPCQPFSSAGKRQGEKDKRHLWPEFFRLIKECKPPVVFGEQVASAEVVGTELEAAFIVAVQSGNYARANKLAKRLVASKSFHYYQRWIDGVRTNLEAENYAVGFAILGAHSVNAPHIRQRLYWMADTDSGRNRRNSGAETRQDTAYQGVGENASGIPRYINCGLSTSRVADSARGQCQQREGTQGDLLQRPTDDRANGGLGGSELHGSSSVKQPRGAEEKRRMLQSEGPGEFDFWSNSIIIPCRDGKTRRISPEPESFPLADGIPGRVAMLRGFGNAIVPQVAAEVIKAYEECDR